MLHGALKFKPETDTDVETPRIVRPVGAGLVAVGEIIIGPRLEIESEILHKIVTDTGSEPNRPQHTAGRQFIIDVGRKHPMIEDTGIPMPKAPFRPYRRPADRCPAVCFGKANSSD